MIRCSGTRLKPRNRQLESLSVLKDDSDQLREHQLQIQDLGSMSYADTFKRQQAAQQKIIEARGSSTPYPPVLLMVEHHPPVITMTRRPGVADHLTAMPEQLNAAGVEVVETNRGGDITYHGPGQLVGYAMIDLNVLKLRIDSYMRWLESIVIDTLDHFGIEGERDACATGVWVADKKGGPHAKVCAMGVRVSRWVSMHGLALNVTTDLSHFDFIVPCGLAGRPVTSLQRLLGSDCPSMPEVQRELVACFIKAYEHRHREVSDG